MLSELVLQYKEISRDLNEMHDNNILLTDTMQNAWRGLDAENYKQYLSELNEHVQTLSKDIEKLAQLILTEAYYIKIRRL